MNKLLILILSTLSSCISFAGSSYQVDLILFAHPQNASSAHTTVQNSPLIPVSKNAISLKSTSSGARGSYQLLKPSLSSLNDQYYLLTHKSRYQVLAQYSWRQPGNSHERVSIPNTTSKGWEMQGTVRVRQSNYYLLDTQLQFSPPSNPESPFTVSQKQRLKPGVLYYLDHPQIGMVVRVHKVA